MRIHFISDRGQNKWEISRGTLRQTIVAALGAFLYILVQLAWPSSPAHSVFHISALEDRPGLLGLQFRLAHLLGNYYLQLAALAIFVWLAVYRRNQRDAWIYAFLSGWAFPELVIFHWLR
jgi:hypothetical protein